MDLGGVVEDDPSEVLGGVSPPLTLLGPVTVTASLLLRGEVDHGDAPAVFGDPGSGPEPAVGVGGELPVPAAEISADSGWVGRPALGDLNEHELPSLLGDALSLHRPSVIGVHLSINSVQRTLNTVQWSRSASGSARGKAPATGTQQAGAGGGLRPASERPRIAFAFAVVRSARCRPGPPPAPAHP